jgi:aminopeptidase YwaD
VKRFLVFIYLFYSLFAANAQWLPGNVEKSRLHDALYQSVLHLVADSLEGREAGTRGEIIARNFISDRFAEICLEPYFSDNTYYHPFHFESGYNYNSESFITVRHSTFEFGNSFSVLSYSGQTQIWGNALFAGNGLSEEKIDDYSPYSEQDMKQKVFFIDISFPAEYDFIHTENYYDIIQNIINTATDKGAAGIILFQGSEGRFEFDSRAVFPGIKGMIPVIYDYGKIHQHVLSQKGSAEVYIQLAPHRQLFQSYNVAGIIDNSATTTIVIGAHYDHLGYGSPISRHVGVPSVHPGADDNASGVAVMIELARLLKASEYNQHNFVFVAFGAEEKGLLGSKAFVQDTVNRMPDVLAMINIDMVGRLDTDMKKLNVMGTGSTLQWDSLLNVTENQGIMLAMNPSGSGGSDHMSFYLKDIPVLFFITGLHKDYHTPNDVIEKINFEGMTDITVLIFNLLHHLNSVSALPFTRAEQSESTQSRRSRGVSLGIIPDHAFGGKGLRIDDVTRGRTADNAGLNAGDIIISIDEYEVSDITSYMKALTNYKSGSKAKIRAIRNKKEEIFDVEF